MFAFMIEFMTVFMIVFALTFIFRFMIEPACIFMPAACIWTRTALIFAAAPASHLYPYRCPACISVCANTGSLLISSRTRL